MSEKTAVATYVSPRHPKLTFHVGSRSYQLKHGALDIFDEKEEKRIDRALAGMQPRARALIRKVSRDAGVKLVEDHKASVRRQAVSGPMGTGHIQHAAQEVLQHQLDTDMAQRNIEVSPEAQDAAHAELSGMMVTAKVAPSIPAAVELMKKEAAHRPEVERAIEEITKARTFPEEISDTPKTMPGIKLGSKKGD